MCFKEVIRLDPDYATAHYNLGFAYEMLGRTEDAFEAYKQVLRLDPNHAMAHVALGIQYMFLGQGEQAVSCIKEAIRLKPNDALAHYWLGMVYLSLDKHGAALDQYRILKDLDRDMANQLFDAIYR